MIAILHKIGKYFQKVIVIILNGTFSSQRSFKSTIGLSLVYSKVMVLSFLLNSGSLIWRLEPAVTLRLS